MVQESKSLIRNFCLIAHVDHGKSTLADRLLELTHTIADRDMKQQFLDSLVLERARGITIKLNGIQLKYQAYDGQTYCLNLIDTPGHIDFSYEVIRSLAACEGAILLIDATQGIQAQTLANAKLALQQRLVIIPVINKIDLPTARVADVINEMAHVLPMVKIKPVCLSAKTGNHVPDLLEAIVHLIPAPVNNQNQPLRALIFDSYHDRYQGVVLLIRMVDGVVKMGDEIKLMSNRHVYQVTKLGIKTSHNQVQSQLSSGEVGWLTANIKKLTDVQLGDTITHVHQPAAAPLPGYQPAQSVVFCHLFPVNSNLYARLLFAVKKLSLSDAAITFKPTVLPVLGSGLSCGFLGLLHMEVVQQRLEQEYGMDVIMTPPSVNYEVHLTNGQVTTINNPDRWPIVNQIAYVKEPWVKIMIFTPTVYTGELMQLCQSRRGILKNITTMNDQQQILSYELPLESIIFDFFNLLKSVSHGFATFQYDLIANQVSQIVKLEFHLNHQPAAGLARLVHVSSVTAVARRVCLRLKSSLPRHNFTVPIQAVVNNKIIARETLSAMRKNVTSGLYGGDISRKKKVLTRQKKGKKRMQHHGRVTIPAKTYTKLLKLD